MQKSAIKLLPVNCNSKLRHHLLPGYCRGSDWDAPVNQIRRIASAPVWGPVLPFFFSSSSKINPCLHFSVRFSPSVDAWDLIKEQTTSPLWGLGKDSGKECRWPSAGCCLEEYNPCGMIVQSCMSVTWSDYVRCKKGALGLNQKLETVSSSQRTTTTKKL